MLTKCSMRVDWLLSTHIRNIQRWDCRHIYYDRKHAMWEIKFPVSIDAPAFATSCMSPTSVKTLSYTLNKHKNLLGKNERIGLRKKGTETREYRIDSACYSQCQSLLYFDHYYFRSLLLLRSILFYIVYLDDRALLQCRIGLISEVIVIGSNSDQSIIVIGIVNSMHCQSYILLFQSLFFAILSFHFFPKGFCACYTLITITSDHYYF